MQVYFVAQPFSDGFDLRDFIRTVVSDEGLNSLHIAVAWAKRSGFRVIGRSLRLFRRRGGTIRMVIGISEGGATIQGLQLALRFADEAFVFHNPAGRTFHPKIYVATGPHRARLLVGSHNVTRGGAVENYEAGLMCTIDTDSSPLVAAVLAYVDRLVADRGVCIPLTEETLSSLVANPAYRIQDEGLQDRGAQRRASDSVTDDTEIGRVGLFGRSGERLRGVRAHGANGASSSRSASERSQAQAPRGAPATIVRRWYKQLSRADAQHLASGNHTEHMTLVQAGHDIDQRTYFRDHFFGDMRWRQVPKRGRGTKEEAQANFEVIVSGARLGVFRLAIDHIPSLESGQGNRATVLRWQELKEHLRTIDHTGEYATLERDSLGGCRLIIAPQPAGPFLG